MQRWDQTWRGHLMFCELVGSSVIFSGIQLLGARARNQHFSHSCTERWTRARLILIATVSRRAEVSANSVPQWQQKRQRQPRLIKGAGDTQTEGHVELAVSLSRLQEQRAVPAGDTLRPPLAVVSLRFVLQWQWSVSVCPSVAAFMYHLHVLEFNFVCPSLWSW